MNKNKKRLSKLLVSMLVLSGMNMDAMEKKSVETSETKNSFGDQSDDNKNKISLDDFEEKIKRHITVDSNAKIRFDLKLLRKMYEKSKENIKNEGTANVGLNSYNIFLTPRYPNNPIFINQYKDFDISFKKLLPVSPISDEEIDNDPSNKNCKTYFTWKNQQILSVIYLAIRTGGLSDGNGLKFIKDNVLVHHGKWGMSKYCILSEGISDDDKSDNNIPALNFTPAKFEKDTGEKKLAQSYDNLIEYCDQAIAELNTKIEKSKLTSKLKDLGWVVK